MASPSAPPGEDDDRLFVALYDYTARSDTEMSFHKGDLFRVKRNDHENWWEAESVRTGTIGWIPNNYVAPAKSEEKNSWFHGPIPRTTAEYLLSNGIDGSYLVRESESNPGEHSISVRHEGKVAHYRVTKGPQGVFVAKEHPFPTLKELIEHHSKKADGLVYPLKHPVAKKQAVVFGVSKDIDDKWEIDRSEITLGAKLGAGQYGEVYEGTWRKNSRKVAVKTLKEESMEASEFLKEANVMKKMRHENLVQLLAICTRDKPMFIITEFMANGCLLDFLRNEANRDMLSATALMHIATQISAGMLFIEESGFIHRDLAARNCLVGENLNIKVADFGLSRLLKVDDVYTAKEGAKFPIKWTAPESLSYNVFTIKSDIWAFGVVLWELATYGKTPYPGVDIYSVLEKVNSGYRMPRPEGCPAEVYKLMRECWQQKPEDRPSFKDIKQLLESMFAEAGSSVQEAVNKVLTIEKGMKLEGLESSMDDSRAPSKRPAVKPRPSIASAASAESASPGSDATEVIQMTKALFLQAQHIVRNSTPDDVQDSARLLGSDAEQLVGAIKVVTGTTPIVNACVDLLAQRTAAMMRSVGELNMDNITRDVRALQQAAKELHDKLRE